MKFFVRKSLFGMLALLGVGSMLGAVLLAGMAGAEHGDSVTVSLPDGSVLIDTASLETKYTDDDGARVWSAPTPTNLSEPTSPSTIDGVTKWGYIGSDLVVAVSELDGRLDIRFSSETDNELIWPVAAVDQSAVSIEFPNGDGQSLPVDDEFWWSDDSHLTQGPWNMTDNLTMPFWGVTFAEGGVSYIVHDDTDIGTELEFVAPDERLSAAARHDFNPTLDTTAYHLTIAPTDGNPLATAQDFRQILDATASITTLEEKVAVNPEVQRLRGALHGYLWGDGDNPALIERLTQLGIHQAWLGYDTDVARMSPTTVAAAQAAGLLVGPYDTWENAQDPLDSDSSTSIWPGDIWPESCAIDANGDPLEGFGGRGCTLSSTAIAAAERNERVLSSRVEDMIGNGVSSYFLDVDATGDLAHDYSPDHSQTKAQDRRNRIERMGKLGRGDFSSGKALVLGSEKAEWWANPALSFSHGSSTSISNGIWELQKDKEQWGGYWPAERPGFFFQPVTLSDALATEMFAPRYRVPLYQAVLHDAVVSTDRWEMGLFKFAGLERQRTLTNMLYNTPAMVSLDMAMLDQHGDYLSRMQDFFAILQNAAGFDPLQSFERLGEDVQRTRFGSDDAITLTVTVNFGESDAHGVSPGCALAQTAGGQQALYCP